MHFFILTKRGLIAAVAIVVATCIWTPCMHLFFKSDLSKYQSSNEVSSVAKKLAATHLSVWSDPKLRQLELDKMRQTNPEWDFMSRTYFVLSLVNMAMRTPAFRVEACSIIDSIIQNTLEVERNHGFEHFLMSSGHGGSWIIQPPRSIFVDGEIALMLAARRVLKEDYAYKNLLTQRVELMILRMQESPVLCAESYPDECWLFCNTVALVLCHS